MNRRALNLLALLLSVALVVALTASGTLAYMTKETPRLVNTFTADPSVIPSTATVPVQVTKTVRSTGKDSISPQGFSFLLENLDTGETLTITTDEKGQAAANLVITGTESYRFRLSEIDTGVERVTYSTVVYEIDITPLVDAQGTIVPRIGINGNPASEINVAFENLYDSGKIPDTGDHVPMLLYALLLLASTAGLVISRRRQA